MYDDWYTSWGTFRLLPDLAVDSDNGGTVNAADAAVEDEGSGVIIAVNDDDDDNDGTPDLDQPGTVAGEDDLVELKLSLFPPDASSTVTRLVHPPLDEHRQRSNASKFDPRKICSRAGRVSLAVATGIR